MSMSIYLPLTETLDFIQSPNSTSKTTDDPTLQAVFSFSTMLSVTTQNEESFEFNKFT